MKRTYKTGDYSKFTYYEYNREVINELNIQAIMKSMRENGFDRWNPIIVSHTGKIADGQHRLEAARRLGIEMWVDEYDHEFTAEEICRMNKDRKSWTLADYIHSKSDDEGAKRLYGFIKEAMAKGLGQSSAIRIAMAANHRDVTIKNGNLRLTEAELVNARRLLAELFRLKPYVPISKMMFVTAYLRAKACENFDLGVFIKKLQYQKFVPYSGTGDLISEIERIYNHMNRNKITINRDGLKSSRR